MTNRFTRNIASGAMILGSLAGLGLASSPAQAAVFTLDPQTGGRVVPDSEWGAPGLEAIWSTWFNSTTTNPPGPNIAAGETCLHGFTDCVNGYDNPLISHSGGGTHFKIEYFGSGNAAQTNDFLWNGVSVFGAHNGATDGATEPNNFGTLADGSGNLPGNANPTFTNPVYVPIVNGVLPFSFLAGTTPTTPTTIANGAPYDGTPGSPLNGPHYFATIDGTWDTTSGGPSITLGLSDGGGNDDDAADYVIRITQVEKTPEPSGILGLLAMSGLGLVAKMRKQK